MKYQTNRERMAFALSRLKNSTYRGRNVVIADNVSIGQKVSIKSNTVIGEKGFGFERMEDWTPVRIEHDGGVIIGNFVEIGALNTVVSGTVHPTVIKDHVQTDDHVHIAHNCHIGEKTLIAAGATISGSVTIGKCCWIGVGCTIQNKVTIGNYVIIGSHANVIKDVPDYAVVAGNPAKILRYQNT